MPDISLKELYPFFFEEELQGVIVFNSDRIVFAGGKSKDILGIKESSLLKMTLNDFTEKIHTDERKEISDSIVKMLSGGEKVLFHKYRFASNRNDYIWLESIFKYISLNRKKYILHTFFDITDLKRDEIQLMEGESRYKNFIEQSNEGISYLEFEQPIDISLKPDKQIEKIYKYGFISDGNNTLARMYGFDSIGMITGKKLVELHGGSGNPVNLKAFSDLIENGYKIYNVETEELTGKGEKKYFINNSIGIIRNGYLFGIWGAQIDITETRKSENRREAAFRISEASHDATDLGSFYKSVHSIIEGLMAARNLYVALYDRKNDIITFPYFADEKDEKMPSKKPSKGLTEYVIRTGKPLLATPEIFKKLKDKGEVELIGTDSVDWLGVPLKRKNKTIGIIAVQSYTSGIRYTKDDQHLLMFVAEQVSNAIDRIESEERLKVSEEKYRNFVEQSLEGIYFVQYDNPIDTKLPIEVQLKLIFEESYVGECNELFARMYGYKSKNDIIGKSLKELYGGLDKPENIEANRKFIESGYRITNAVTSEVNEKGENIYFLNNVLGIVKFGKLIANWGTQIDITEQIKAEKSKEYTNKILAAIAKAEEILLVEQDLDKGLNDAIKLAGVAMNADRVYIFENYRDINTGKIKTQLRFEWCSDRIKSKSDKIKLHSSEYSEVFPVWEPILGGGRIISGNTSEFTAKERKKLEVLGTKSMLVVPVMVENNFWGFAGFDDCSKDRVWLETEKTALKALASAIGGAVLTKQIENSLKLSEITNKAILSAIPDLMFIQDSKGNYLDFHARDYDKLFVKPEDFIGKNMRDIFPEKMADELDEKFQAAIKTGEQQIYEYSILLPEKVKESSQMKEFWFEARIVAYENDKILSMVRDITALKNSIEGLKEAKQKAEDLNRLKSNFLANMSHELRTPLHGILGFAQIMMDESHVPEYRKMSETIYRSGTRLLDTLNLLLNFSKTDAGKLEINYTTIDVCGVVSETLKLFEPYAANKGLKVSQKINDKPLFARLDEKLFREILVNLLNNAIKFTEEGGITVESGISGRDFYFKVIDTGIGIPEDKHAVIFEEFRQVSEGLSRNFEGTGLGLTLTKKFIEMLKGKISVESKPGEGSVFTVHLPLGFISGLKKDTGGKSDRSAGVFQQPQAISSEAPLRKILLVENDFVSIQLIKTYLKNLFQVDVANNGITAIEMAGNNEYNVVLMDINLGQGMTGIETTQNLRKLKSFSKVPIIAVTAFAMESDKEEFLGAGCSDYIAKPFDKYQLIEVIKRAQDKENAQ